MDALALAIEALDAGVREVPAGSNRGPDVDKYMRGCVRSGRRVGMLGVAWCAAFASWCLWEAHGGDPLLWTPRHPSGALPIGYRASVRELVSDARATGAWRELLPSVTPRRGDLLVMRRHGQDPRWGGLGHVAFVESWDPDAMTGVTVGGNEQDAVRRTIRSMTDAAEPPVGWIALG